MGFFSVFQLLAGWKTIGWVFIHQVLHQCESVFEGFGMVSRWNLPSFFIPKVPFPTGFQVTEKKTQKSRAEPRHKGAKKIHRRWVFWEFVAKVLVWPIGGINGKMMKLF